MQLERFSSVVMNVEDLAKALLVLQVGCATGPKEIVTMEPRENWGVELTLLGWNFDLVVPASKASGPRMEFPLDILASIVGDYASDYPDADITFTCNHGPDGLVKFRIGGETGELTALPLKNKY
jgi:hypothetical protein